MLRQSKGILSQVPREKTKVGAKRQRAEAIFVSWRAPSHIINHRYSSMLHRRRVQLDRVRVYRLSSAAFVIITMDGDCRPEWLASGRRRPDQPCYDSMHGQQAENFPLSLDDLQIAMRSDLHVGIPLGYTFSPSKARRTGKS